MSRDITRRSFLAGTAGVSAFAFGTGSIAARQAQTFELAMTEEGWVGRSGDIQGQSSPTLRLEPNKKYAIKWTNRTDERHNLVVTRGYPTGKPLVRSSFLPKGESQTITFMAPSEPGAYFCENHTGEVGPIAVGGKTPAAATTTLEGQAGSTDRPVVSYRFFGSFTGWRGRAPEIVGGQTNPTLLLVEDRIHEFVWQNVDGAPHNFILETEDDEMLVRSDTITSSGSWQTVKFVATADMYQYYCQFHPLGMRGDVELVTEQELEQRLGAATTTPANQTATGNNTTEGNQSGLAASENRDGGGAIRQLAPGAFAALGGVGSAAYLYGRGSDDE